MPQNEGSKEGQLVSNNVPSIKHMDICKADRTS